MLCAQNFGANVANLALPLQDLPLKIKCKKAALKHQQTLSFCRAQHTAAIGRNVIEVKKK